MACDPAFWDGYQWVVQPRVAPGAEDIHCPTQWPNYPGPRTTDDVLGVDDDVRNTEVEKALRADPVWPVCNFVGSRIAAVPDGLNGSFPHTETGLGFFYDQQLARRVTMTEEPGGQAPGVANNGVTLRHPPAKLPMEDPSAIAPEYHHQEALTEEGAGSATSKAMTEAPGKKRRKPSVRVRRVKVATEFVCEACTKDQGHLVSFTSGKDLRRHLRATKAHDARAVSHCSCGKSVTRRDAMAIHRRYCRGTTVEPSSPMVEPRSGTD